MKKITLLLLFFCSLAQAQVTELALPYSVKNVTNKPIDYWYYNPATLLPWENTTAILTSATRVEGQLYYVAGGDVYTFKGGIADANLVLFGGGGSGTINTGTAGQMAVYSGANAISGLPNILGSSTSSTSNLSLTASIENDIYLVGKINQFSLGNVAGTAGVSIQNFNDINNFSFYNNLGTGLQIQQFGNQSTLTLGHSAASAANINLVTTSGTSSKISNSSGGLTFSFTLPNSLATNVPGLQLQLTGGIKTITNVSDNYIAAIFTAPLLTSATAIGSTVAATTSAGFYIPQLTNNITHGNLYGLRVFGNYSVIQGTGSSVTNAYAAYFEAPTGATNNYALGLKGKMVWKTTLPATDNTISGLLGLNASGEVVSRDVSSISGGGGDMILASTQTNTGAKTFNDNTLLLNNVAGTFASSFTNTNTAARVYTLPDATGTVSLTSLAETFSGAKTFSATTTFNGGATISTISSGSWIDMPTTGPSGIGSGGAGNNLWVGYVQAGGQWFANSVVGDIAYRNTSGKLLFGNTAANAAMALTGDQLGIGTTTPSAKLHVVGNAIAANHINGFTTTATAAGTTTLTASSNKYQQFTGTNTHTVVLPTTSIVAGQEYLILNGSTGNVTVNASNGGTVKVMVGNRVLRTIALVATPTTNAQWQIVYEPFDYTTISSVNTLTGTANQVIASNSTGNVVLSLPQNIHSAATPTFAGLTVSGLSTSGIVTNSAAGLLGTTTTTGSGSVMLNTSPTVNTSLVSGTTSFDLVNTTATTLNVGGAATTFNLGGTASTSLTANLFANATASGQTKTINIGNNGTSGSTTVIEIGSNATIGSNTYINMGSPYSFSQVNISTKGPNSSGLIVTNYDGPGPLNSQVSIGNTGSFGPGTVLTAYAATGSTNSVWFNKLDTDASSATGISKAQSITFAHTFTGNTDNLRENELLSYFSSAANGTKASVLSVNQYMNGVFNNPFQINNGETKIVHLAGLGGTPTLTPGPGAGTGGSLTYSILGNDVCGQIILQTGNSPASTYSNILTVNFSTPYNGAGVIVLLTSAIPFPASATLRQMPYAISLTNSSFIIKSNIDALDPLRSYNFNYHVIGY